MEIPYGDILRERVDAQFAIDTEEDGFRSHLGASVIGRSCMRAVWFSWLWCDAETFDGRMLRLFQRGHRQEDIFAELLRAVGAKVYTLNPQTGEQFRVAALGGHFGGSMDGCATNLPDQGNKWFLLEFKTHNERSFRELKKKGVAGSKPQHVSQGQVYMHLSEGLHACLYVAVNKNTDEIHFEIFPYDPQAGTWMLNRAESIIFGQGAPPRIASASSYFECKFCAFWEVCWNNKQPKRNCRTCAFSRCGRDGTWSCAGAQPEIMTQPKIGCQHYQLKPDLCNISRR